MSQDEGECCLRTVVYDVPNVAKDGLKRSGGMQFTMTNTNTSSLLTLIKSAVSHEKKIQHQQTMQQKCHMLEFSA